LPDQLAQLALKACKEIPGLQVQQALIQLLLVLLVQLALKETKATKVLLDQLAHKVFKAHKAMSDLQAHKATKAYKA
jgi:hypothetical protein